MKIIDRHLLKELIKFAVLALVSVVSIYLLIDLFEELGYFTSRKVSLGVILLYYFYSLPAAVVLLYPVSLILAVFVVYGQMTRNNELSAFKNAGVMIYRLFVPAIIVGVFSVVIYLLGNEFITVRFNQKLSELRRVVIEKRSQPATERQQDVYRIEGNVVLWTRELEKPVAGNIGTTIRDFTVVQLDKNRHVLNRIDGDSAVYTENGWIGTNIEIRRFDSSGTHKFERQTKSQVMFLKPSTVEFGIGGRPIDEMSTIDLHRYITQLRATGENVAREEVEYHYRFSYALIGLIVVLLGLPFSVRLRRGGVMFGLGLGLLFSFLYWGVIQTCRAFGTSHVVSPLVAAWLPNIIFGTIASVLLVKVER
uniref:YjgP/YjgQ family permease n=1 Tax=candidate division WOR-3 bacterium TaxID=2052148 RepID=A0A7V3PSB4_UNCW3